jgi:hypothetical protein
MLLYGCAKVDTDIHSTESLGKVEQNFSKNISQEIKEEQSPIKEVIQKIIPPCSKIFNYPPVNLSKVKYIRPLGAMNGAHVTPTDHQYYITDEETEVYSPADGYITDIQHMTSPVGDSKTQWRVDDYRLSIMHPCKLESIYIHVDRLSPKIAKEAPKTGTVSVKIPVKAGEIIGAYNGSVDYNVVDFDITLKGFIDPKTYNENWKMHIPDPFDYFKDPIKKEMVAKCLRYTKPYGGKIDYDIDGKLVGNWFKEGTNGYSGLKPERYWADHLTIAYDSIDPEHIIVSIGTFNGKAMQFGVKGNSPDPANVSVKQGLIKYELAEYDYYYNNKQWDRNSLVKGLKVKNNDNYVKGMILLQLLENRKLKVEIFPEKTDVKGFTNNAMTYVR